jgi:hypothetical protein
VSNNRLPTCAKTSKKSKVNYLFRILTGLSVRGAVWFLAAALLADWREQMHLPPTTRTNVEPDAEAVAIGSGQGKLFDIPSEQPVLDGKSRARILVAMETRGSTSWFFKMTGEASSVREQKPGFIQFLQSVKLPDVP